MKLFLFPLALLALVGQAIGAALTPGNILVSKEDEHIYEFTTGGTLVQTFTVPEVDGQTSSDYNRDMVVDRNGRIVVYNGTFAAQISVLDPTTGTWTHLDPVISVYNNGTYGKLATWDNYVFATDHKNFENELTGIVRFDMRDGTWTRFAEQEVNEEAIDVSIGANGLLYSLNGAGSPSGRFIEVYDPLSLSLLDTISLPLDFVFGDGMTSRDLYVDIDGNLFLNQLNGPIYKLAPDGTVLDTFSYTQDGFVDDMDVSAAGFVLLTQSDGIVTLLDQSFQEVGTFDFDAQSTGSFGAWVENPVPEPGSIVTLGIGAAYLLRRRRRSGR